MLDVYLLGDEAVILVLHVNLGGPLLKVGFPHTWIRR
jgi:hypothetical protein